MSDFDEARAALLAGRIESARRALRALVGQRKLPRANRLLLANLARRAGEFHWALRLLRPVVVPPPRRPAQATDDELAEYATSLARIGGHHEAARLFDRMSARPSHQAIFLRAISGFALWEYSAGIAPLEDLLSRSGVPDELRASATVRLAAAYLRGARKTREAKKLLVSVVSEAGQPRFPFFQLHARLVLAELHGLAEGDFEKALSGVLEAERLFPGHEQIWLDIWKAVLTRKVSPRDKSFGPRMAALRNRARASGDLAALRTCDLYSAAVLKDRKCLEHAYFGTSFPAFRERLLFLFGEEPRLPTTYEWNPGKGAGHWLDPLTGLSEHGATFLKEGGTIARLLATLAGDFYRRIPSAEIHEALHPGKPFDVELSPPRVRIAVIRLREWLARERIPVAIELGSGGARIGPATRCLIRVGDPAAAPPQKGLAPRAAVWLEQLGRHVGKREFSAEEAAKLTDVSPRTALDRLASARGHGHATVTGRARSTRYRLVRP